MCSSPLLGPDLMLASAMPPLPGDECILVKPLFYVLIAAVGLVALVSITMSLSQLVNTSSYARVLYFCVTISFNACAFALLVLQSLDYATAFWVWTVIVVMDALWVSALLVVTHDVIFKGVQRMGGTFSIRAAMGEHWTAILAYCVMLELILLAAVIPLFGAAVAPPGPTRTAWWRTFQAGMAANMAMGPLFAGKVIDIVIERIHLVTAANSDVRPVVADYVTKMKRFKYTTSAVGFVFFCVGVACAVIVPYYYFIECLYILGIQSIIFVSTRVYARPHSSDAVAKQGCFARAVSRMCSLIAAGSTASSDSGGSGMPPVFENRSLVTVQFIVLDMFNSSSADHANNPSATSSHQPTAVLTAT